MTSNLFSQIFHFHPFLVRRVVIDVAIGEVDVIFSPEPQMLIVETNKTTWRNEILLDPTFNVVPYDADDGALVSFFSIFFIKF